MAHERTITIDIDGKFFNIVTVFNGVQVSNEEAIRRFKKTFNPKRTPSFDTLDEAVSAAAARSRAFDGGRRR